MENEPNGIPRGYIHAPKSYALSGKIMLSAIIILFTVVVLILCLHIYARCFLLRRRRNRFLRRRSRLLFASATHQAPSGGLDAAVLRSLPVFVFSPQTHPDPLECAVCLCEFEEKEKGRLLPKCNHSFHTGCIDMWFHSHSTCPLCRSAVKPDISDSPRNVFQNQIEIVVSVETETERTSEAGPSSGSEETGSSSSSSSTSSSNPGSSSFRKKALGFVGMGIEVPRRNESFKGLEEDLVVGSPLRSPGSGILALRRILSRDRRAGGGGGSSSAAEIDVERGEEQGQPQR
ncbi:RING-H2 finger protein ATL2 [Magnolia sinica]|uniref:RING-H2 finger protein ATL2 n=1 Tax=Magnolia sinica TaxID=86752 RepID=UPI002658CBDA|nr:RING-H2 finger protein ATL2 [Magnolia sinica]